MSPAAAQTTDEAAAAVLGAADELLYAKGINAVTMAELRDTAGVSMRRLYGLYAAKSDVVTAWLEDRHTNWMLRLTTGVDRRVAAGQDPLGAVFGFLEEWMAATDYRGCGFINTHAGAAGYTTEQRTMVRRHKSSVDEYLTGLVPDIPGLAVLLDGAIVQASIYASPAPIRAALKLARAAAAPSTDPASPSTAAPGGTP